MQLAVDACVLVALINPRDLWHAQAKVLINAMRAAEHRAVNFDCAVTEAASVLVRRLHEKGRGAAAQRMLEHLNTYIPSQQIVWILPDVPRLYLHVLELMRASDGELNFNDALMALACREREIPAIVSFDADFDRVDWLRRIAAPDDLPNG